MSQQHPTDKTTLNLPSTAIVEITEEYERALQMTIKDAVATYIELSQANIPIPKITVDIKMVPQVQISLG